MTAITDTTKAFVRLFFALPLPEAVARKLVVTTSGLRRAPPLRHCRVRWVPEENLHATLKFLGPQLASSIPALGAVLDSAAESAAPTLTRITRLTAFPSPQTSRIIVAELADPDHRIGGIAATLERALNSFGVEPEHRPFMAHVTLARLEDPRDLTTTLERAQVAEAPFTLSSACLYESDLDPSGARYRVVHRSNFSGGG